MEAVSDHPDLGGDLGLLTLVQVDAHADLRDELNGERFSHGTAVRRALDAGVGRVIQIGTRALSRGEAAFAAADGRVETWFARDFMGVCDGQAGWARIGRSIGPRHWHSGPRWSFSLGRSGPHRRALRSPQKHSNRR